MRRLVRRVTISAIAGTLLCAASVVLGSFRLASSTTYYQPLSSDVLAELDINGESPREGDGAYAHAFSADTVAVALKDEAYWRLVGGNRDPYRGFVHFVQPDSSYWQLECGWPFRAARGQWWRHSVTWCEANDVDPHTPSRDHLVGLLPFSCSDPRDYTTCHLVPCKLLYAGLVANVAIYSLIVASIVSAPAARRHLRLRRHLCPHCAYPTGNSTTCSECGTHFARSRPVA